ncbi:MAG TPA: proline--tRNA ligase [Clostridiaceae bacterium]|nr:proline--tRNA ligase [Clostridiaceae bacterium]
MRLSKGFFYTLREQASDEDSASGNLLVRAGMIKKVASGIYMMMPLGLKALNKVIKIIREEMNAIGSKELLMPALIPEGVYVNSGRRETFGDSMFSLKDRYRRHYVLGPTHEELFAAAAKMYIRSYKDLPFSLYQFQTKYRDEPRPRFGLIRLREFIMKDAYTFDLDLDGLHRQYMDMFNAYKKSFDRMGLNYVIVNADTGVMGGLLSEEFQALSEIGEDILVIDDANNYASNIEVAPCILRGEKSTEEAKPIEKVYTPESKTIEEVTSFMGQPSERFVKTMIYNIDGKLYAVCCRGDHEVNETKVVKLVGGNDIAFADAVEVEQATGAPIGFAGPIGIHCPVLLDQEVTLMKNFIVGANEADHHLMNVNLTDFKAEAVADLRRICEGDLSEKGGPVRFARGIEIGNTFKLGTKYAEAMDLYYKDETNEWKPVVMGSYGIGPARCLAAIVEQNHSEKGILWPKNIAPVEVGIVIANVKNEKHKETAEYIYSRCEAAGFDVLLDDRNERAGVKFNDMELIGAYARITCGRGVDKGLVELKCIGDETPRDIPVAEVLDELKRIFAE